MTAGGQIWLIGVLEGSGTSVRRPGREDVTVGVAGAGGPISLVLVAVAVGVSDGP